MNKILLAIAVATGCVSGFAQGKINIMNDANHAVYYRDTVEGWHTAGELVTRDGPVPIWFSASLWGYAGTAGGSMELIATADMNPSLPGIFGPLNLNTSLPGGSASTFMVRVIGYYGDFSGQPIYFGNSEIFTMRPGGSIAYNNLVNPGGQTFSTWAQGAVVVPGGFGAIAVGYLPNAPEPSSLALASFGAASLLFFRRGNSSPRG